MWDALLRYLKLMCREKQKKSNWDADQELWLLFISENHEVYNGSKHHQQDGENEDNELLAILLQDPSGHVVHTKH